MVNTEQRKLVTEGFVDIHDGADTLGKQKIAEFKIGVSDSDEVTTTGNAERLQGRSRQFERVSQPK